MTWNTDVRLLLSSPQCLLCSSRGEVDMHHRDDGLTRSCALGLAAEFKEEVRAAVSGMVVSTCCLFFRIRSSDSSS